MNNYLRIPDNFEKKSPFCMRAVHRILDLLFPSNFFKDQESFSHFNTQLPMISATQFSQPPFNLSFFLCCHFRPNAFHFFYEMISRWLIPDKRLNPILQFAADFSFPHLHDQKYVVGEVMVQIRNLFELRAIQNNLPLLKNEIHLGLKSYYQACRILEMKGLRLDEKNILIQEVITSLIQKRPQDFDYDLLSEMHRFLVISKEGFKKDRSYRHIGRIICVYYLFGRALQLSLETFPERRYISVKLIRAKIRYGRPVLGIVIGLSYIHDHEIFESRHILSGIQAIIPTARKVPESYLHHKRQSDQICMAYIEIEKEDSFFTLEEQKILKIELPQELKNRFESRLNPIFMPQNEEMIIRNILTLSNQLKFVRDLPQVMIEFSQQMEEQLEFLITVVRLVKQDTLPISDCFKAKHTFLEFIPDRQKIVGTLRKKYHKEASVFRLRISKGDFFRRNHVIDLYKARKKIASELTYLIGEFRDYNGGMISQESELFDRLKRHLGHQTKEEAFLLENYFYSLVPSTMRSLLPMKPIKKLFLMILEEELDKEEKYTIRMQEDLDYFYSLITSVDLDFHKMLQLGPYLGKITTCLVPNRYYFSFGLIFRYPTTEEKKSLRLAIEEMIVARQ
ncbi:MAG: hypothetical protein R3E91_00555 [Chlamydiales bacterium]